MGGDVITGAGLERLTGDGVAFSGVVGAGVRSDAGEGVVDVELEPEGREKIG